MNQRFIICLSVLVCLASTSAGASELFTFEGKVNFRNKQFTLDIDLPQESSIRATGKKGEEDDYRLKLDVEHFKSPFFQLSSQIESSIAFGAETSRDDSTLFGKLSSQYSLIDYKPTKELSGHFEIKNNQLFLNALNFGDVGINGSLGLKAPYELDLIVGLTKIPMQNFLDFWAHDKKFDSSGEVSGNIRVGGTIDKIALYGNLNAHDGHIESLNYDDIAFNASGIYPDLQVEKTMISKSNGFSFQVDGPVDISDRKNFKKQVKALKVSPLVTDNDAKTEWTIKKVDNLELGSTEFKYLLRKDTSTHSSGEDSAMLGIEQKLEF